MARATQQRLPWAPPTPPPSEISVGLCAHNRLVGFWEEHPSRGQMNECNGTHVKQVGVHEFQRLFKAMCPLGCIAPPPPGGQ